MGAARTRGSIGCSTSAKLPPVLSPSIMKQDYEATFSSPLFWQLIVFGPPLTTVLVAAVAGYVSPRGFWLWGFAAVFLWSVEQVFTMRYAASYGVIGPSDYPGLAVVVAVMFVTFVVVCTAGSGAGAGLRLLVRWLSGRFGTASEGEESGLSERGGAGWRFDWINWRTVVAGP